MHSKRCIYIDGTSARITLLVSNVDVCLSGLLLTVLPDVSAARHVRERALRRLPFDEVPRIEVFTSRRLSEAERPAARELRHAVARALSKKKAER